MSFLVHTKFDGYLPDGRRRYFKGGGGDAAYYDELNTLYKEQAESARLLREQAEANLPGAVNAYVNKVSEATSPERAERQAGMAAADMASANAMERAATTRELASMGVNPNDARFAGSMRSLETNNAARMAAGKNLARNDAEKYGLAVAQDAVGTFTGQSNSASSQMAGASSGLSNLASQKTAASQQAAAQQSANTSNAVGGAMAVGSMFFRDGGEVRRLANGGAAEDEDLTYTLSPKMNDLIRKGMQHTVAGQMFDGDGDGRGIMSGTVVGSLFKKDGGKVDGGIRILERHMLGGAAGQAQQAAQHGFFQMQPPPPPPAAPAAPQQPQGINIGQIAEGAKTGKRIKDAGGVKEAMQAKAASNTDKLGHIAGKFSDSAGNQIQSHAAGMRMAGDGQQAKAAVDAYEAAASQTTDPALAESYRAAAANIEAGAGLEGAAAAGTETAGATVAGEAGAAAAGEAAGAATAAGEVAAGTGAASGAASGAATGAATSAGSAALGGAMAAVGTAMPWIGAAYAVGSLLGAWKDGGEIPGDEFSHAFNDDAKDYRDGDAVTGPGSHTDDIVPALLSAGEGVLNGEAMALGGDEVMEDLNRKGLELRKQGVTPDEIRRRGYGLKNLNKKENA